MNSKDDMDLPVQWMNSASALQTLINNPVTGDPAALRRWRCEVVELANNIQGYGTALAATGMHLHLSEAIEQELPSVRSALNDEEANPDVRTRIPEHTSLPPSSPESSSDCYIVPQVIQIDTSSDDRLGPKGKTTNTSAPRQRAKPRAPLQKGKAVDRNPPERPSAPQAGSSNQTIGSTAPTTSRNIIIMSMFCRPPAEASKSELEEMIRECTRLSIRTEMEISSMRSTWDLSLKLAAGWKEEKEVTQAAMLQLLVSEKKAGKP